MKTILDDLVEDSMIKHLNLSYNIPREVASDHVIMESLFEFLIHALTENTCMIALDWSGNNLGTFTPHPPNQHVRAPNIL